MRVLSEAEAQVVHAEIINHVCLQANTPPNGSSLDK